MAKRRIPAQIRATLGGLAIAIGSLYALTVSYDIPRAELIRFLIGSVLVLLGAIVSAALIVLLFKSIGMVVRKILRRSPDE